jgi:hypothetical protein
MSIRPRTWWLLGGCGCALVALLVVGVAGLWYLWPRPAPPRKPPQASGQDPAAARTIEAIRAERNRTVGTIGPTVYSGTLDPGREATITCDPGLTLEIPAGAFTATQRVTVKRATVHQDALVALGRPIAAYEVTIGKGGPLPKPITLIFTHDPIPATRGLLAARWDTETTAWVPLRLTRKSTTVSVIEADHLSIEGLFEKIEDLATVTVRSTAGRYERRRSADGRVVVHLQKGVLPALENLFVRPGDPSRSVVKTRIEKALDDGGYTILQRPRPDRYTDGAIRDLFVDVLTRMGSRIMESYRNFVYNPPLVIEIYVDTTFANPKFLGGFIGMSPTAIESPEELAVNLAHECFHACQQNTDLGARTWMGYRGKWLAEATAEYASTRVAWGNLQSRGDRKARPFLEEGVALDGVSLQSKMGDGITRAFLALPLTGIDENDPALQDHPYHGAHLLEYLFKKSTTLADLQALFHLMSQANLVDSSEKVLERYGGNDGMPFDETWSDFVAFLILDKASPAEGELKTPHPLRQDAPSWSGPLVLPAIYTGTYESFILDPRPGEPVSGSLRLTLEGPGARVVVYRSALGDLDLSRDLPTDRAFVTREPKVMIVPIRGHEMLFVVASRGDVKDPGLTLRAELTTLAVTATSLGGGKLRLEVQAPATPQGPSGYRWDTGDPRASGAIETRTNTLEHTYSRPGEHEVKVTLLEGTNREPAGEAIGRVTVPSSLKITVFSAATGRPLGGVRVRLRYEGKTVNWGTDPSGVGWARDVPPRTVSFSLEAAADGYETFSKTAAFDMSKELEVAKTVTLTPKPRVAPPPTTRPPAPPSEPPSRPAPEPEPPPVPTPTPKAEPKTPTPDDCMAKYRPRLNEVRAHNRAQDPASNSMVTRTMGVDAKCGATYNDCIAAAKERERSCRPGSDGTFTQCIITENREWLSCANEEIDCCERALAAQCGMK